MFGGWKLSTESEAMVLIIEESGDRFMEYIFC